MAGVWESCEARCYAENKDWFPAFAGPATPSGGQLVAFVGYEDDPCQDTAKGDIRLGPHGAGKRGKKGSLEGVGGSRPQRKERDERKDKDDRNEGREDRKGVTRERRAAHPLSRAIDDDDEDAPSPSSRGSCGPVGSQGRSPGGEAGAPSTGHWADHKKTEQEQRTRGSGRDGRDAGREKEGEGDDPEMKHEIFPDVPDDCVAYVVVKDRQVAHFNPPAMPLPRFPFMRAAFPDSPSRAMLVVCAFRLPAMLVVMLVVCALRLPATSRPHPNCTLALGRRI